MIDDNTPPDPEPVEPTPEPETTPAEVEPAEPEGQINKSEIVRGLLRRHPDWSYRKIQRYFAEKFDTTITTSTICRAKTTNGRIKGKPRPRAGFNGPGTLTGNQWDLQHLAEAMAKCVTPGDINLITRKVVEKAVAGDLKAAELLFNRLWGKPKEHISKESTTTRIDLKQLSNDELDRLEAIMEKTAPTYPALPAADVTDADVIDTNNPETDGPEKTEDK